jgi:hypothetical protein
MTAVPQRRRLVAGFPPRRPFFSPKLGHVKFVVDKAASGRVSFEYFGFASQFSFHQLLYIPSAIFEDEDSFELSTNM